MKRGMIKSTTKEIRIRGKLCKGNSVQIDGKQIDIAGKTFKIARQNKEFTENIGDPSIVIKQLKSIGIKADIFTFCQKFPEIAPNYQYYMEYDSIAALPITTYEDWIKKQVDRNVKRAINRARKRGVITRIVLPDEKLTHGIVSIFNESPIRQGKKFWHYGKDFEAVKKEIIESDNQISEFVGAYFNDELIGFIKLIYNDCYSMFVQILSKLEHRNKAPNNALIAKAVEICDRRGLLYLIYGEYIYGKKGSDSLSDFKRRNGFQEIKLPRYYVPLSLKGKFILKLKLHRGIDQIMPNKLLNTFLSLRTRTYVMFIKFFERIKT